MDNNINTTTANWSPSKAKRWLALAAYPLVWAVNRPSAAWLAAAIYDLALRCNGIAINYEGQHGLSAAEERLLGKIAPQIKGGVVFDVGANVGSYTQALLRLAPGVEIHAFEPHPSTFARLPAGGLRLVPNGVDLQRFRPGPADALLPGEGPWLGTAAALRPEKNVGRLLRAAALLRGQGVAFRLAIMGDGPERPALETLARDLGLTDCTHFLGHVADPAATCRALDVFALSSDTEQMPFAVLEAMASGLAVASTDVGDVAAMLSAENRPHLAALDEHALAAALGPLLRDAALRASIGRANRARAEQVFDQEAMFQAHAGLIDGFSAG
jgi:glycosyltransferase involved in cell wall biosynthesis